MQLATAAYDSGPGRAFDSGRYGTTFMCLLLLFAADSASLVRLRTFESLWVESAMDFWPDFVISSFTAKDAPQVDTRMAAELERRKKPVVWKWSETATEDPPVSIQGVMTNRPSAARQKWGSRL